MKKENLTMESLLEYSVRVDITSKVTLPKTVAKEDFEGLVECMLSVGVSIEDDKAYDIFNILFSMKSMKKSQAISKIFIDEYKEQLKFLDMDITKIPLFTNRVMLTIVDIVVHRVLNENKEKSLIAAEKLFLDDNIGDMK